MTQDQLAVLAGLLLSLGFSYIPGLKDWYGALSGVHKRLTMLVCIMLAGGGVYLAGCASLIVVLSCDRTGLLELVRVIALTLVANQSTYSLSPALAEKTVDV